MLVNVLDGAVGVLREELGVTIEVHVLREVRLLEELVHVRFAHDRAAVERPVVLRADEGMRAVRRLGGSTGDETGGARAQRVGVEADALVLKARDAAPLAAIAKRQAEREVRHAGLNPDAALDRATVRRDGNHVAVLPAELRRRLAADEHGVVPDELGNRVGQLLEPAVVRITTVVHARVAVEDDFELVLGRGRGCGRRGNRACHRSPIERTGNRRGRRANEQAVVQELLPLLLVERAADQGSEGLAGEGIGIRDGITEQVAEHFGFG